MRTRMSVRGVLLGALLALAAPAALAAVSPAEYVPAELLVKFVDGTRPSTIALVEGDLGARTIDRLAEIGVLRLRLEGGLDVESALARLARGPYAAAVAYAEPNYVVTIHAFPNDPRRNELYGMHNVGQTGGTADADIDALEAWAAQTGSPAVVVADIDTGMDMAHEDLVPNLFTNAAEAAGAPGVDDDGNGYVDDLHGWDFYNNDNDPSDDHGHGTHTAGTIGAAGDNGKGVAGVAWHVRLMPLKVFNSGGSGDVATTVKAVLYLNKFPAVRVTNNSYGFSRGSNAFRDAIRASGALFSCSAGNDGNTRANYPASYSTDLPNVVAVAATDANDALASFSSYSATWVNLGAPGVNTLSSYPGDSYRAMSGTSMASPHVAGTAALVVSQSPAITAAALRGTLLGTVDPLPSLNGKTTTGGRLNAARALGLAPAPADAVAPGAVGDLAAAPGASNAVALTWTAPADDGSDPATGPAYLYEVRYLPGEPVTDANWSRATAVSGPPLPGAPGAPETLVAGSLLPATTYYFALRATDEAGNASPLSNAASATTVAGGWTSALVDASDAFYTSMAIDPVGIPGVIYGGSSGPVQFSWNDGSRWIPETVDAAHGGTGLSLAVDPGTGAFTATYSPGALYFATRDAGGWTVQPILGEKGTNDVTSLAYDLDGLAGVTYRRSAKGGSDLRLARRSAAGAWTAETIEVKSGARYNALAFHPATGDPWVAFSADLSGDGFIDSVKCARKQGTAWQPIEVVYTVPGSGGTIIALSFGPYPDHVPTITFQGPAGVYLSRWNGVDWDTEVVTTGNYPDHAYDAAGKLYVAFVGSTATLVASRATPAGEWTTETADPAHRPTWAVSLALDPAQRPRVAFRAAGIWFAERAATP